MTVKFAKSSNLVASTIDTGSILLRNMNKLDFENAFTVLPQDFFFFEENFGRLQSSTNEHKNTFYKLKSYKSPINEDALKIAFQQMISLTSSFREGKTIAEAIAICETQLNSQSQSDSEFDFDVEVLKKVTEKNTEKIRTRSTNDSEKDDLFEQLTAYSQHIPRLPSRKHIKSKAREKDHQLEFRPDWVCKECIEYENSETKKAIELLCNRIGGGGWVLTFTPRH